MGIERGFRLADVRPELRDLVIEACERATRNCRGLDWEPCWKAGHACRKFQQNAADRAALKATPPQGDAT